jgi:hypothetical protein
MQFGYYRVTFFKNGLKIYPDVKITCAQQFYRVSHKIINYLNSEGFMDNHKPNKIEIMQGSRLIGELTVTNSGSNSVN